MDLKEVIPKMKYTEWLWVIALFSMGGALFIFLNMPFHGINLYTLFVNIAFGLVGSATGVCMFTMPCYRRIFLDHIPNVEDTHNE